MKAPITLLTLATPPLSLLAVDVTGTWKANFDTQRGLQKYTFTLKQDGTNITGKASVDMDGEKRESDLQLNTKHAVIARRVACRRLPSQRREVSRGS